jgi:hypothetical protein
VTFVSQSTSGFGTLGLPEAPGFIERNVAGRAALALRHVFRRADDARERRRIGALPHADVSQRTLRSRDHVGLGYVSGSTTNATYWGESLFPTLNPHLGSQTLGYGVAFPTHAGQDDGSAFAASV